VLNRELFGQQQGAFFAVNRGLSDDDRDLRFAARRAGSTNSSIERARRPGLAVASIPHDRKVL
jgi:hypothetical protein